MTDSFLKYFTNQNLFSKEDRVLIATSGGIDSTVLCHLFHQTKLKFGIAHCNFKLRGNESDKDQIFVKNLAESFKIPFYSIDFETAKIANERKTSIQIVARDLRYEWLENIRQKFDFQYIATAHHSNDSIETVVYNFTKGCGIRGLHGILPQNGNIIRPLLFATKIEIENFARNKQIGYREDASNATDKYARNKIRHHVIPVLKELNPAFEKTGFENIERLREVEKLYDFAIEKIKKNICFWENQKLKINIQKLTSSPAPQSVLYEILNPFGFNNDQTKQILQSINNQSINSIGKQFHSLSFTLNIDREYLNLKEKENFKGVKYSIEKTFSEFQFSNHILSIKTGQKPPKEFPKSPNKIYLDESKIEFPLILRHWEKGDYFHPFGMGGKRKKLSDFFTDLKLSRFEKEEVWILESDFDICWIVGHRMDERFKVRTKTTSCVVLEFFTENDSKKS